VTFDPNPSLAFSIVLVSFIYGRISTIQACERRKLYMALENQLKRSLK